MGRSIVVATLIAILAFPSPLQANATFLRHITKVFAALGGLFGGASKIYAEEGSITFRPAIVSHDDVELRATRIFSGPSQYPPSEFAAYGIVAFPSLATSSDRDRHIMICEAYVATLPSASEVARPPSEQMVTVWPVETDELGRRLTLLSPSETCSEAVGSYNQLMSQRALRLAERTEPGVGRGRGPFLLAWSPGEQHGSVGAHILHVDMSRVETEAQAKEVIYRWARDIETNPELWRRGWDLEKVRIALQAWSDDIGGRVLPLP